MLTQVRFLALCAMSVAVPFSSASAQQFKTIQYPGATTTILNGGPNI